MLRLDRMHRLTSFWKWLPTFRAVAEQQHLTRAAERLGVRPSAASRMIKLLEADLGQPLFSRVGRNIQLNAAGELLLTGVRTAIRTVDDSLSAISATRFAGPVYVACSEPVTRSFLLPALDELNRQHPDLVAWVQNTEAERASSLVLRGSLDLAIQCHEPAGQGQLEVLWLGTIPAGLYVGPGHPLHPSARVTLPEVLAHPFVHHHGEQGYGRWWPAEYRRQIAISVAEADLAAEICAAGRLIAALPTVVADHAGAGQTGLRRLPLQVVDPIVVYALRREQLVLPGPIEALIAELRQQFGTAGQR